MDEKIVNSSLSRAETIEVSETEHTEKETEQKKSTSPSTERAAGDHRQAYGTAKTENLRDSGLWRVVLPVFVGFLCLLLLAIPLLILIPLLTNSISAMHGGDPKEAQLLWLWIAMIVIEVSVAVGIIWGLCKIFMTQAGNYQRA